MDLKATLKRAANLSRENDCDMVVGDDGTGEWIIMPLDDPRSDSLAPGIIVDKGGIRYPEDIDTANNLMRQGR
ncbi:hypothetical protein [Desulfovibrio ferrophilus]|uniref:Uncharacterized protein n=1 Tax=Desulfovibrio ferrophilus TaxID=241368 RepID=A0A2Z6AVI9_9BACT|nr:hypothetical protein [Desulfovibrio ferrophilus]BBD07262.1 uncharacterized protein DFE_0536 [Desulfovibrio ferrophilus]